MVVVTAARVGEDGRDEGEGEEGQGCAGEGV